VDAPADGAVVVLPAEPPTPVCASAKVLDRASADANAIVANFMIASSLVLHPYQWEAVIFVPACR
jgi:hypothetical protein